MSDNMAASEAKKLLVHYLYTLGGQQGEIGEVEAIVDYIVDAAVLEVRRDAERQSRQAPDFLSQALNEGDGVYRP